MLGGQDQCLDRHHKDLDPQRRLISLEAMLFVAAQVGTAERSQKLQMILGDSQIHPFAKEMGKLVSKKWHEQGIEVEVFDAGDRCFDEVQEFWESRFDGAGIG